ncbi:competence/damage-inducible protein A [Haliovirga abyssi]|uniref:CinA-like protein n=1 Tax=Haliovirga abyssi TaxID=2996794 RepID=A0AAU9DXD7_9FUSO|nr:competence/damage-inducible protein A [Haliovirga abyssi]BDU50030.1 CinA-like protein [Haliovirga abyssi]
MKCYIILVGTELLNGMMVDTNSIYMAENLNRYGVEIVGKSVVGDKIKDIEKTIKYGKEISDFVVISGGLGPTIDDLTRDAVAKFLDKPLTLYKEEFEKIKEKFKRVNIKMAENNIRQAKFPEGAIIIDNKSGAAPAFLIDDIAVFPGVPSEVKETFPKFLNMYFKDKEKKEMYIKDILVWGLPESELEEKIYDIILNEKGIFVEFLVKNYGIIIRFLAEKNKKEEIDILKEKIYSRIGKYIFGEDEDRIERLVLKGLENNNYTISTAESCTGGMVATKLIGLSGISKYYKEGLITYSNESKIYRLGVEEEIIVKYGAVSEQTVNEMLDGLKTDVKIAISGIAGPTGGTKEKPVGTVYIGIEVAGEKEIKKYLFRGDREVVRERAALTALNMVREKL